jgi:hypothetical protein
MLLKFYVFKFNKKNKLFTFYKTIKICFIDKKKISSFDFTLKFMSAYLLIR